MNQMSSLGFKRTLAVLLTLASSTAMAGGTAASAADTMPMDTPAQAQGGAPVSGTAEMGAMGGADMPRGQGNYSGMQGGDMGMHRDHVMLNLAELNNSGIRGTAMLVPQGNQTKVMVQLEGAVAGGNFPAHIHEGSCANPNPTPKLGLENVRDGRSVTLVNAPLSDILAGQHLINVHKSPQEISVYVACGNITR